MHARRIGYQMVRTFSLGIGCVGNSIQIMLMYEFHSGKSLENLLLQKKIF